MSAFRAGDVPIVRIFGKTNNGETVAVNVHGFAPFFYCNAPTTPKINEYCRELATFLNRGVVNPESGNVLDIRPVKKQSLMFYHEHDSQFLQIFTRLHVHVSWFSKKIRAGFRLPSSGYCSGLECYDVNVPYIIRFLAVTNTRGCGWVKLSHAEHVPPRGRTTTCDIEVDVRLDDLEALPHTSDEYSNIVKLKILSFDIECAGRKGVFPEPEIDPVIQIGMSTSLFGTALPWTNTVLVLGSCAPIPGVYIIECETEEELLMAFSNYVVKDDPDMITGYNINDFDLPYLLDRATTLRLSKFPMFSRMLGKQMRVDDVSFASKAFGARVSRRVDIDGRIVLDMLEALRRDYKLRKYTLNAVSAHFLGSQKEDVHHSIITTLHEGTADDRSRLASYCLKDAKLPLELVYKLMIVYNYVELSRVTGVPFSYILKNGQQVKVQLQILRESRDAGYLFPLYEIPEDTTGSEVVFEGATVLPPKRGYYDVPIATLDFASLYPSIMMAHNFCYSTLLNPDQVSSVDPEHVTTTPLGHKFVKSTVRQGIVPTILHDLLTARKKAKAALKVETNPFKRNVLDGRQLALKISANSVYGFTGASVGKLPCIPISASVTAFGRQMIDDVTKEVYKEYTVKNGYKTDADVVYGDTDSVMIKFGVATVQEAMELGKVAAVNISKIFLDPIKLEFEKVYYPYLLINKKMYAGVYWTCAEKYDKLDCKGLVPVRRDNCPLVSHLVGEVLRRVLIHRDVDGAVALVHSTILSLRTNDVDISKLVITMSLSKEPENYANMSAHVTVALKRRKRDPGSAPVMGDRVPYVMIQGKPKSKGYENGEDPVYVMENNLPIDAHYYLHNQLEKPLMAIFTLILGATEARRRLFTGPHMQQVVHVTSKTSGPMMAFVKRVSHRCIHCRVAVTEEGLCTSCKPHQTEIYIEQMRLLNIAEKRHATLWRTCQDCHHRLCTPVDCNNSDCPIFYERKKAQLDAIKHNRIVDTL
jgi:DNA polymerase delta subunit 1